MDLYIYSDESGVFDVVHNTHFIYGGMILLGSDQKREAENKYRTAEKVIRQSGGYPANTELKATVLTNKEKGKLYRSMNQFMKFGVVVEQNRVLPQIFEEPKSKQRYLDYVYKIGLKHAISAMALRGVIGKPDIRKIHIIADEHATATNGRYELQESLLKEFKIGMYNSNFTSYIKPILPDMDDITVQFLDSAKVPLIRAADIIANRIYHSAINNDLRKYHQTDTMIITVQP